MKNFLRQADISFAILGLSFFSGVFGVDALGDVLPSFVVTLIRYLIWFTSSIVVIIQWKKALILANRDILLCLFIVIALLSFTWSEYPNFTWFNTKEVFMMTSFGLYFATRFSLKEQVKIIACTLLIGGCLSVVFAFGLPSIGIHGVDHPGAWKGVYGYKNTLGSMMVLSSLAFFSQPKESSALYRWGGFIFSLVLMLRSTSKTALVLSFLLILMMVFYRNFKWRGKSSLIFLDLGVLILGCVAVVIFSNWVELLTGLGRDPTLTGRIPVWNTAFSLLTERPLLGFGRGAFWAPESGFAVKIGSSLPSGWIPPHAHNGFLDIALDFGFIGLSLFIISYLLSFVQALKLAYATKNPEEIWPLAYLIFLAMNNMTESYIMRLANLYLVLYIATAWTIKQRNKSKNLTMSSR